MAGEQKAKRAMVWFYILCPLSPGSKQQKASPLALCWLPLLLLPLILSGRWRAAKAPPTLWALGICSFSAL